MSLMEYKPIAKRVTKRVVAKPCFRNVFRRAANRQLANFKERGLTKMSKARHC
jgi:hypothetical protein